MNLLRKLNPDIVYCIGFNQRLGKNILSIPSIGCINLHPTLLPAYRGLTPYFWIMANNEKESGVSFHLMDEEWDKGKLVIQKRFKIRRNETMQHLFFRSSIPAREMLIEIQKKLKIASLSPLPKVNMALLTIPGQLMKYT